MCCMYVVVPPSAVASSWLMLHMVLAVLMTSPPEPLMLICLFTMATVASVNFISSFSDSVFPVYCLAYGLRYCDCVIVAFIFCGYC